MAIIPRNLGTIDFIRSTIGDIHCPGLENKGTVHRLDRDYRLNAPYRRSGCKNKNPRKPDRITGQKISYYEKKLNIIERKTRLELATPTLARSCSTN